MGRIALILTVVVVATATSAGATTTGTQPYTASNSPVTYSTTSAAFGTATATIQETSGQSTSTTWTYCAGHAVDGSSCAAATHLPAGTVSKWVTSGATRLATLPNGAQCYEHTDSAGTTWCYAGEAVQDSIGATGGPFGTGPATGVAQLPNQGEAWWGSGGGPNSVGACEGMFDNAPSTQSSLSSCESQFGTVTWDTSGSEVAAIRNVADELAWRIGAWNGSATPGGVSCGSRTAVGSTSSDSQAPSGLWMQWSPSPARGFWNCTSEDGAAGPPATSWNGSSWYSRSYPDWNGFGWYLLYYDYASFVETNATAPNGVATSITCNGDTSATTATSAIPSGVVVAIDESSGVATFDDQSGHVLSEVSCINGPSPQQPGGGGPPPTTPPTTTPPSQPSQPSGPIYLVNYALSVPVGQTGAVNILSGDLYSGTPQISISTNAPQPGQLDSDPQSIDFGYFVWTPTYPDEETAFYSLCAGTCGTARIYLTSDKGAPGPPSTNPPPPGTPTSSTTLCPYYCGAPPPTTIPPSPNVTLQVSNAYPFLTQQVTLTAAASDPTSPAYTLSIVSVPQGSFSAACPQTLGCVASDVSNAEVVRTYVAVLTYTDGDPPQYSNEVTVYWAEPAVTLDACTTPTPCRGSAAAPAAGAPAYLTATAQAIPQTYDGQPLWQLQIIDAATKTAVGACPNGLTPCQTSVTGPDGTTRQYYAVMAWENGYAAPEFSSPVNVTWGTSPSTPTPTTVPAAPPTTMSPPPTTTVPPTTLPPPAPTTTIPTSTGGGNGSSGLYPT